jgi:quercetin dioxygenase-like cupin family protein
MTPLESIGRGGSVRKLLVAAACLTASTSLAQPPPGPASAAPGPVTSAAATVLDNARVRVWRASGTRALAAHPAAVVVVLEQDPTRNSDHVFWSGTPNVLSGADRPGASFLVVEPRASAPPNAAPSPAASATPPPVFVGMNFTPVFDNDQVRVLRARMDVGAKEGLHTHGSDLVVIYLSDGEVEDTANGTTKVDHWKRGDVEFEARGSSHSTQNLGAAIDAFIVGLKP